MTGSSFDELAERIMDEYLSREPAFATQVGWHKYDHTLKDLSRKGYQHQIENMSDIISKLESINPGTLTPEEQIDRDLGVQFFKLKVFEIGELSKHDKASLAATELGNSLFFLFTRETPPFDVRLQAMIARLEAAPEFINRSKDAVTRPYRLWNEILLETGERMPTFLREVQKLCESRSRDGDSLHRLGKAVHDASAALEDYNQWMRREVIPSGSRETSIGPKLYQHYLNLQQYGITQEETLKVADLYLKDTNRKKANVAEKTIGSRDVVEVVRRMRAQHAMDFESVLAEYRASVLKARDFVAKKGLVTLPDGEKLMVIATPSYMNHAVPYAAQYEPGKFDNDRTGFFLVTPEQGNPAILEEHSHVGIVNTAVHEGYPGHHLHGICMNINPSRIRIIHPSPDFGEGWGLYCEDMMISQGYNDTAWGRLTMLNDLGLRIARQICDVRLSIGEMSLNQAADLLVRETGTDPQAAMTEAKAMVLSPTYYMSYFVGKLGILQMREDAQRLLGNRFDLRFFHDSLIYSGCMPMPFMRRALALRIKERYGLELGLPSESVFDFGMRALRAVGT